MLGTVALILLLIAGYLHLSLWWLVPAIIVNSFIGLHFPPGKAMKLVQMGEYWKTFLYTLPLQGVFAGLVFAIGYGLGMVI
tara:strand:+ start:105 stop:347 length:243 start_codon:yes stop_codon:yes gene_type:complete